MEDSVGKDAMIESKNRVQSMGIIHQRLYQGDDLGAIEMKDYFQNLGEGILDTYGVHDRVKIMFNMAPIVLDVDTAIPIGLIVNEVITNSMKYAFPNGVIGQINISLKSDDGESLDLKFLIMALFIGNA